RSADPSSPCPLLVSRIQTRHLAQRCRPGRLDRLGPIPRRHQRADGESDHHGHEQDRKSTRLNSSHEWISYAVFCLKKKRTTCTIRRGEETGVIMRLLGKLIGLWSPQPLHAASTGRG